jgi:hypothetical protein
MFGAASATELVEAVTATHRQESMLAARRLAAISELLGRRIAEVEEEDPDPGYMMVTGFHRAAAEVAAAMNVTPKAASILVTHADLLTERLPKVFALLANGHIDWRTTELILSRTELVADSDIIAAIDAHLAGRISSWQCWSRKRIVNAVDAAVRELDADAVRERPEDRCYVSVRPRCDGSARLDGILSSEAAILFDRRLAELTDGLCSADPRSRDERRDAAVAAMAAGEEELACRCGTEDCPQRATPAPAKSRRWVINVFGDRDSVLGGGNTPGYVAGFGVIDAETLREIADGATLRMLTEPIDGDPLRYQPSAALDRWIRARDLTCRFPGCDHPAERCDIDHTVPFDHDDPRRGGHTVAANLKCLCRDTIGSRPFTTAGATNNATTAP